MTSKSVKLNVNSRIRILEAVMTKWDIKNPIKIYPKLDLLRTLFSTCIIRNKDIVSGNKLLTIIKNTENVLNYIGKQDLEFRNTLYIDSNYYIKLHVQNVDSSTYTTLNLMLPEFLAKEIGVPRYSKRTHSNGNSAYFEVPLENKGDDPNNHSIEVIGFPFKNLSFTISRESKVIIAYEKAIITLNEKVQARNAIVSEVRSMLEQFNTTKQLAEAWPEIIPHIPTDLLTVKGNGSNLPVPLIGNLNKRLGI